MRRGVVDLNKDIAATNELLETINEDMQTLLETVILFTEQYERPPASRGGKPPVSLWQQRVNGASASALSQVPRIRTAIAKQKTNGGKGDDFHARFTKNKSYSISSSKVLFAYRTIDDSIVAITN